MPWGCCAGHLYETYEIPLYIYIVSDATATQDREKSAKTRDCKDIRRRDFRAGAEIAWLKAVAGGGVYLTGYIPYIHHTLYTL